LGGTISSGDVVEATAPSKSTGRFVFEGDGLEGEEEEGEEEAGAAGSSYVDADEGDANEEGEGGEGGDGDAEGEEADDIDMQIAWETLDLARVVYEKMGNKLKVADVLLALGDVSLELGKWKQLSIAMAADLLNVIL
jgi:hypothetical protein